MFVYCLAEPIDAFDGLTPADSSRRYSVAGKPRHAECRRQDALRDHSLSLFVGSLTRLDFQASRAFAIGSIHHLGARTTLATFATPSAPSLSSTANRNSK